MRMKEDGERKGWQTRGKSFFSAARGIGLDLGWVSVAPRVQEQELTKWSELETGADPNGQGHGKAGWLLVWEK